ncbi:uncharacterized protein RB166_001068 [Leptodactylus fuscus]|uniref:uncharacterized protein LOC142194296 n=1 Tax=Leptodactylus fuscus TaxID=238119 RepID=UPI003F4F127C
MFQILARCHEEEQRHRAALESPFQLLRGLFLQLDMMRCWNKLVTVLPRLQDLLEVCSSVLVPRPQSMCLSCRGCQAVESEVSPDKRQKCSSRRAVRRRLEERRHSIDLHDCVCDLEQTGDLSEKEERFDQRQKPGLLGSIQQLKNSLKKDLETHQLYLRAMGTRLSGLERRARDVTRHLERANLELEAIKQGSVTLKTLVDQQISSCPDAEDLEDYEDILREAWQQSRRAGRSEHPESYRTNETVRSSASEYPAGGVGVHQREELQTCQRHVSVLIQQITRQINQMESDIKFTSKQRQSTR